MLVLSKRKMYLFGGVGEGVVFVFVQYVYAALRVVVEWLVMCVFYFLLLFVCGW